MRTNLFIIQFPLAIFARIRENLLVFGALDVNELAYIWKHRYIHNTNWPTLVCHWCQFDTFPLIIYAQHVCPPQFPPFPLIYHLCPKCLSSSAPSFLSFSSTININLTFTFSYTILFSNYREYQKLLLLYSVHLSLFLTLFYFFSSENLFSSLLH